MKKTQTQKDINRIDKILDVHTQSLQVSNHEMAAIKEDMGKIKEDMAEIKAHVNWIREVYDSWEKRWDKLDNRIWAIIALTGLGTLISIALNLYFQ